MGQKTDQLFGQWHEPFDVSKGSHSDEARLLRERPLFPEERTFSQRPR